jgi:hypothetical protein
VIFVSCGLLGLGLGFRVRVRVCVDTKPERRGTERRETDILHNDTNENPYMQKTKTHRHRERERE